MSKITDRNTFKESVYISQISVAATKLLEINKGKKRFILIYGVGFRKWPGRKERKVDIRLLIASSKTCPTVT